MTLAQETSDDDRDPFLNTRAQFDLTLAAQLSWVGPARSSAVSGAAAEFATR